MATVVLDDVRVFNRRELYILSALQKAELHILLRLSHTKTVTLLTELQSLPLLGFVIKFSQVLPIAELSSHSQLPSGEAT